MNDQPLPTHSWKYKFKRELYERNFSKFHTKIQPQFCPSENQSILNIIQGYHQHIGFYESHHQHVLGVESASCIYCPLNKSIEYDDEILNTFPYVKELSQRGKYVEKLKIFQSIFLFIDKCKQQDRIKEGWEQCLKRFLPQIDAIRKVEIYLQLLKYGDGEIRKYREQHFMQCFPEAFSFVIMRASKYFKDQININKALKFSLQVNGQINAITMPKTMKMLYCSICFIYDCNRHKIDENQQSKNYQYINPRNTIPQSQHIKLALALFEIYSNLTGAGKKPSLIQPCSRDCFLLLSKSQIQSVRDKKINLLLTMVQGLIELGINLYSYNPCMISVLFPKKHPNNKVTCAMIFLYLMEEYEILKKIQHKFYLNQVQFLRKQAQDNPAQRQVNKKKKKRCGKKQFFDYQTSICFHHYLDKDPFDLECQQCVCNERGFCLPQCQCSSDCKLMIDGCQCLKKGDCRTNKCHCYKHRQQCIPGICLNCFGNAQDNSHCKNVQILKNQHKLIRVGRSRLKNAGYGGFAGEPIQRGDLVSVYTGQVIEPEVQNIRELILDDGSFYNFALNDRSIDARHMGNKSRFINHGNQIEKETNLIALNVTSQGQQYIGLYAQRYIQEGEELLFDYDYEGHLTQAQIQKYPFLQKEKN